MACPGSFQSNNGEKHPDLKSGCEVDLDKLGCSMSCQGGETDPYFCVVGSAPVEQDHNCINLHIFQGTSLQ